MNGRNRVGSLARVAALALVALGAVTSSAGAQSPVEPYQENDFGGFHNILPAGECQVMDTVEFLAYEADNADKPAHCDDQRLMYQNLIHATPGLQASQIADYYKDGSFGVKPGDVARTYHPGGRPGLTVIRDSGFGVPHVYGETRADVMFGAGYVGAEDRLFFMDVLRHAGRAQLSAFAGGSASNKAMDASVWDVAPYKEADLQRQFDLADEVYGSEGVKLQEDVTNYVAGVNRYISEAYTDPTKLPAEYLALLKPLVPWKISDVIATASLIGGIFGKGGGGELGNATVYNSAIGKFGASPGTEVWQDLREANDPEAPTTVHGTSFPYQNRPGTDPATNPSVAIPDPNSLVDGSPDDAPPSLPSVLDGLGSLLGLGGASNALLVAGSQTQSGHPDVVFGPQVGYFSPEILMEEDLHGPDIDARGATFTGVNLYVLLGRGQDFAWSATSAGQDIIDTFAEKLCNSDGSPPTINSMSYMWRGQCRPIEVLERTNVITPSPGDLGGLPNEPPPTPGLYHLVAQRTVHGIVSKRGTVGGQPVAFAKLRSTYFHEADSARAFSDLNQPSKVQNATDFQHVMSKINFTFNWFYTDDKDIAYFNSGDNPVRADGTDPEFPAWGTGQYDWKDWDPVIPGAGSGLAGGTNIARYTPYDEHPQVVNQDYITSWNNKQAPGYRAAEDNYAYGPNFRSQSLDDEIESRLANGKMTLTKLIDSMEVAGSVDLRGTRDLPLMLDVLATPGPPMSGAEAGAVATLQAWVANGAHRRDLDSSGGYDDAAAVQLMDAWWPRALDAAFKPTLGTDLFNAVQSQIGFDDPPGPVGSAYISGWFGYVNKDLRSLLGRPVTGPFSRGYCGGGNRPACRAALLSSLDAAIGVGAGTLYPESPGCLTGGGGTAQMCHDAIRFTAAGALGVDAMEWINRPTWQQAVEVQGHQPRPPGGGGGGGGTAGALSASSPARCLKKKGRKRRACLCRQKKKRAARRKCRRKLHARR